MKKTKTNIPELRFPGFEGEWEEKKLGDIFSVFKSGQSITSQLISSDDIYPVYGGNGLRGYTSTFTHDGQYILIGRQGALCGNVLLVNGRNYISEHAIAANTNIENSNELLSYRLDYLNLNRLSESSAQPGLSVYKLEKVKIHLPNLIEQQKIAQFLGTVDKQIEQLEKMVALQEKYKKGMMQRIFNQEIRFRSSNGTPFPAWQQKKLGDIGNVYSGKNSIKSSFGKYPVYGSMGIIGYSDVYKYDSRLILVARVGANAGSIRTVNDKCDVSDNTLIITLNKDVDYLYVYQHLLQKNISKFSFGSGQPLITASQLKSMEIFTPILEEQKKIARFLSALDEKIEQSKAELEKAKNWKKGLMQRLFV